MKLKQWIAVLLAVVALLVPLTACSSSNTDTAAANEDTETQTAGDNAAAESDDETTEADDAADDAATEIKWSITIPGASGSLCNSPTYLAYELGYFAEEGIDAELITADFETKKVGLNNGTISTVNGDFQYFQSIEAGVGMTIVGGLHQGCIKLNVLAESDIETGADLEGKTIAVDEIGGSPYQVTVLWLAQYGLSVDDVNIVAYNDSSLEIEALKSGQVDVAAVWDPIATISTQDGTVRTILDIGTDEPFAGHFCCFLYASTKVVEEQPKLIAAELRAYYKAQNWIYENPEEAVRIVTEKGYVSLDEEYFDIAVELVRSYSYPSTEAYENGEWDIKGDIEYYAQALYDAGFLTTDPEEFVSIAYTEIDLTLGLDD
ncbi:MAG: ABC transporter substrate-binding protein [Oscillospiraceae bacterium]|nr:ABC transporter substrate-binding protein [Oscillospiraceae bacterium]